MIQQNNLVWWTGVVEDRNDPEQLGRCKVRIFGIHSEDTNILPTKDLPWAMPLQSITSAASSGVGVSPVGFVTGTWVMGIFLDGDQYQQPLVMGTIAGKPDVNFYTEQRNIQKETLNNYLRDAQGKILYDNKGQPITRPASRTDPTENIVQINDSQIRSVVFELGKTLSNGTYEKVGENGELGKFQFSISSLVDLGLIKRPSGGEIEPEIADDASFWTGKDGIRSKEEFLNNKTYQENLIKISLEKNYKTLLRLGKITEQDSPEVVAGLLASAHIVGPRNSDKFDKKNEDGTKTRQFFRIGVGAVGGDISKDFLKEYLEDPNYLPISSEEDVTKSLNNEELSRISGFQDPNKKYPKSEYAGKSDVNKLAVGDDTHVMFTVKENNRIEKIPLARSKQTWDEPGSAFGSVYPYNQVIETEAGHVIEIDSTPNAERIHVYHKKGSYIEIDVNGSMVRKTVGENYEIMDRNNFVYVKGAHNLTVEGKTTILVKDNATIEVEGDLSVTGRGDTLVQTAGTLGIVSDRAVITARKGLDLVSDETINIQGKNINLHSKGGTLGIKSDRDLALQSGAGGTLSLKGGLATLIDAAIIKTKMGAQAIAGLGLASIPPPEAKTPDTSEIPVLQRNIVRDSIFLFDSGEEGSEEYKQSLIDRGIISDNIESEISNLDLLSPTVGDSRKAPVQCDCGEMQNYKSFPRSFKLSKYFRLGDLLVGNRGSTLVEQKGLSEADIVCNLKQLAVNCLDPIREKYPDMIISSGFRVGPENSDHNIGGAADLQFKNTNFKNYKQIAEWIVANVPYKQVLLEYRFNESSQKLEAAWIHMSLVVSKGSVVRSRYASVGTFKNHSPIARGRLINLA